MVFIGDELNKSLSIAVAKQINENIIFPEIVVFPDGERRVRILESIHGEDIILLKTSSITHNIDSYLIETAFLVDAIKRNGAKSITAIIPYIPYSRADHITQVGEGLALQVVVNILVNSGLNKIILVDPHSDKITKLFGIDALALPTTQLFADKIKEIGFDKKSILVSPDEGGLTRVIAVSKLLGDASYTAIEKKRDHSTGEIISSKLKQDVKENCFLIDDMITSGATILKATEQLKKKGAKKIYVMATHGILTGDAGKHLQESDIERIIITDSIPFMSKKMVPKLEVISIGKLLGSALGVS